MPREESEFNPGQETFFMRPLMVVLGILLTGAGLKPGVGHVAIVGVAMLVIGTIAMVDWAWGIRQ